MRFWIGLLAALTAFGGMTWAKAKPLVFWVNSQSDEKYYLDMIRVYRETKDKDFQAEVRSYGFTEMPDKLAVAFKSGVNPPDIVQLDEIYFSLYLGRDIPFVDLTERVKRTGLDGAILPQRMGLFRWKERIYGIPQSLSNVVLFYRQDVFRDLGITPMSIDTWEKFEAVAKKVGTPERSMLALDWSYFEILMRQRGYELFDEKGAPVFDSKVGVETLTRLVEWGKNGVGFKPDRGHIFDPDFLVNDVANNKVLSIIGADWYGLDMLQGHDTKSAGKWRAMPLPVWTDAASKGRRTTSSFSGQGLVIYKKSKQADRAWNFIHWVMTDVEANVQRYLQGNCFPPYRPAWTDIRFSRKDPYFGNQALGSLLIEQTAGIPEVAQSPYRAQFVSLFREKYWNSLLSEAITPEQALKEIKQELLGTAKAK